MYVIIGANGFLGAYLIRAIQEKTNDLILAASSHVDTAVTSERVEWVTCDVTKPDDVKKLAGRMENGEACKVLYLAAYHHPDLVEKNPKHAWEVNIIALAEFLNTVGNVKCLFYPSTDTVYGEGSRDRRFTESDPARPVNRYGRHKAAAEAMVTAYGYNVVRYPFLAAPSLLTYKKHFFDVIAETLSQGKPMEMFADSYRSSLDFGTVAALTVELMERYTEDIPKILNVSGDDDLSKYDVGLMIAQKYGYDEKLVVPVSVQDNTGIFGAKRAQSALMDNTLLKRTLGIDEIRMKI